MGHGVEWGGCDMKHNPQISDPKMEGREPQHGGQSLDGT